MDRLPRLAGGHVRLQGVDLYTEVLARLGLPSADCLSEVVEFFTIIELGHEPGPIALVRPGSRMPQVPPWRQTIPVQFVPLPNALGRTFGGLANGHGD
jgi:hypothetical protein